MSLMMLYHKSIQVSFEICTGIRLRIQKLLKLQNNAALQTQSFEYSTSLEIFLTFQYFLMSDSAVQNHRHQKVLLFIYTVKS